VTRLLHRRGQGGEITAFLLLIVLAMLAFGGLVMDGGMAIAAKRRAMNEAQAAARAGANQISESRYRTEGSVVIDCAAASAAAREYLTAHTSHVVGSRVDCDSGAVHVSVQFSESTSLLGLVGISSIAVDGTGVARNAHGVVAEGR
jgi:Flp pilus assembly protein TadG